MKEFEVGMTIDNVAEIILFPIDEEAKIITIVGEHFTEEYIAYNVDTINFDENIIVETWSIITKKSIWLKFTKRPVKVHRPRFMSFAINIIEQKAEL